MKTKDYSIFRNVTGNRQVTPAHVESLAAAIERRNLLEYFPVLVNENMEVIDGQHRLMAAAKLNVPIHYEKVKGLTLDDIMSINTASKNWSINDFIDAYVRLGNAHYAVLQDFIKRHGLGASVAAGLLRGYSGMLKGGNVAIRAGTFKVLSEDYAEKVANRLGELQKYADFKTTTEPQFIQALMKVMSNEDFDYDRLLAKLSLSSTKLQKKASVNYYILALDEAYNYHAQIHVDLYAASQTK